MLYKTIGKLDFTISQVGLGTWQFSNDWGKRSRDERVQSIKSALDCGINYFDTALEYGAGISESILGKALNGLKDIIISTKIPPKNGIWAPACNQMIDDFFPKTWIIECLETSLKNLKRDCVDILFLHTWNASWGHNTDWFETMHKLKKQGKIRSIGISVSDFRSGEANVHIESGRVDVVQAVYNVFEQEPEYMLFPLCEKHNVGAIARCSLSSGALSGKWNTNSTFALDDWRSKWAAPTWLNEQLEMADLIKSIPQDLSLPELAMIFTQQNSTITSALFGSTNPIHIQENVASLEKTLSQEAIIAIKNLWLSRKIHGVYNGG